MTREDICTCGQYSQCPTCGKSRSNYAELMKENERMREALEELMDWQNGPPLSSAKWVEGWGNAMAEAERLLVVHGRKEVTP
jgi:hypothetical protein